MPKKSQRPPSPITAAEPDPPSALAAALPPPTPPYEPTLEITAKDLARRNNWSKSKAGRWLADEVNAKRWTARTVMDAGHEAQAYRPVDVGNHSK